MLIFDSKKGKFGTQKPKQWGPISSVRSAVFRNAEAMGIDPQLVTAVFPMWEHSGDVIHDITCRYNQLVTSTGVDIVTWRDNGFGRVGNPDDSDYTIGAFPQLTNGLSIVGRTNFYSLGPDWTRVLQRGGDDGYGFSLRMQDYKLLFQDKRVSSSANAQTDATIAFRETVKFVCASDRNSNLNMYIGSDLQTSTCDDDGGGSGNDLFLFKRPLSRNEYCGWLDYLYFFDLELNATQAQQFHEAPYALLQPNPTPLIFDLGAGSGTWTHKIFGVSPAKVSGVSVDEIQSIGGVE